MRADRYLLSPVRHRGIEAQADLMGIRVRAQLVELRAKTVNAVRGPVKPFGQRIETCVPAIWAGRCSAFGGSDPRLSRTGTRGETIAVVEELSKEIDACDRELELIVKQRYEQETGQLRQVAGVGAITALTFVLTLDDPARFGKSRDVGCFPGLRPSSRQSGASEPEMRIGKEGDGYLRTLLVQCAQYILSRRGPATGLKIGAEDCGEGPEESEEAGGGGGGAQAGGIAAPAVGKRGEV